MYIVAIIAFVLGIVLFGIGMFLSHENEFKKILVKAGVMCIVIAVVTSCCYAIFQCL